MKNHRVLIQRQSISDRRARRRLIPASLILILKQSLWLCLFIYFFLATHAAVDAYADAGAAGRIAGFSTDEALRLGEAMYLKGVLPSGKPLTAVVQGDIKVKGMMTTCSNCHMRSGLGSFEGSVLTLPTNGAKLFSPLMSGQDLPGTGMNRGQLDHPRRAYTDESLANALRSGIDPEGRKMSETMPRYVLDDREMEIMIFYLKHLSSEYSPGVAGNEIRVATVVAGGVPSKDRQALLEPLKAYIREEWNPMVPELAQVQRDASYRTLSHDVWELNGPADTWGGQLEKFYQNQPVFALLGGVSAGKWDAVHKFCEKYRVPCILPITDLPEISESDWYTLYFSGGYYQEGEAAAKYLARVFDLPADKQIIQVFRNNSEGNALSSGFMNTWKKLGHATLQNMLVSASEKTGRAFWQELSDKHRNAVILLWLSPEDLSGIAALGEFQEKPSMVFVSSTMLAGKLSSLPDEIRDFTFITYPNTLPEEQEHESVIVTQWLEAKKIPQANMAISSKVYFLTRVLSNVLINMRNNAYRDYFLDLFDVLEDQTGNAGGYPRLSFGPGQRYASKGCYIVTLTKGPQPRVVRQSDWVIY
jgi:ABC-type branched-subunit amino acid transport system substrate-binding protein